MLFDQDIILDGALQTEALVISVMGEMTRYSLRIKRDDIAAFQKASGFKLPPKIGTSHLTKKYNILCLGPDEWMLIVPLEKSASILNTLDAVAEKFTYCHTDISHRNIGMIVKGPQAQQAINVGCPLDLSLNAFPIGKVTRTVFENASILVLRTGETEFQVECWRSFAPYLCGFFDRFAADL